jgi:glycosyltransferase involved in cell wall biosynthesis
MLESTLIWYIFSVLATINCIIASFLPSRYLKNIFSLIAGLMVLVSWFYISDELITVVIPAIFISTALLLNSLRFTLSKYSLAQINYQSRISALNLLWVLNIFYLLLLLLNEFNISSTAILEFLTSIGALVAIYITVIGLKRLRTWSYHEEGIDIKNDKLPTVTLAIPARNEDHALTESLKSAVNSNYPKLEILVLDDCSQDKTAQIIRSFAHQGVRFVQGEQPAEDWLGKNRSYSLLAEQASGELILFCGVDINLGKDSINKLVDLFLYQKLEMISVLPIRRHIDVASTLLQPLRYLKRITSLSKVKPPVLSSCWLINLETLKSMGSFDSVKNSVIPEQTFATKLNKTNKYRFIISSKRLDINTRKRFSSQLATATRTLYPLLNKSLLKYLEWNLIIIFLTVSPFIVFAVFGFEGVAGKASFIQILSLLILNTSLMYRIHPASWWLGIIQFPIAIVLELSLLLWSLFKFEYSKVDWKGRNICVPVFAEIES